MGLLRQWKDKQYYKKVPYTILNEEMLQHKSDVTIVVPIFNASESIKHTIDSVLKQTMGLDRMTIILVDDNSTDGTQHILEDYANTHTQIISVLLEKNTGTPAFPRNLGAHLANSTYLFYLDADDWLHPEGIQTLFQLLEKTGDDYAVGKSIKVVDKGEKVAGKHGSNRTRHNASPYTIKHIFYHLGPTARMMRLELLRKNEIRYPEMRFAEDKQFFIDVILAAGTISTTTSPIYYINRYDSNESLVTKTSIFEKIDANISVLKYVLNKHLEPEKEKLIVNRLIEFDAITRLFDRKHFVKSKQKEIYYKKFHETMKIFAKAKRSYQFEDTIIKPINRIFYQLAMNKDYQKLEMLARWSRYSKREATILDDKKPYYIAVLEDGSTFHIPINVQAKLKNTQIQDSSLTLHVQLYGHIIPKIEGMKLTSRSTVVHSKDLNDQIEQNGDEVKIVLNQEDLDLHDPGYSVNLIHSDYEQVFIETERKETYSLSLNSKEKAIMYQTVKGNVGLKIASL
ncbi:glycosyltransferase family 2 protein [Shouchella sp. 1P09AA]|uniref:glycosyltransferase family 2 protein n=1 Tax=unclassified Shouchella TaxID=2893065 RepID=UPI0039A2F876